ncbi:hypothetical protein GCM10020331_079720 [Ectobacillus funiculus]
MFEKLNVPFFCFHDSDIAPEGNTLKETYDALDPIVAMIKDYMKTSKNEIALEYSECVYAPTIRSWRSNFQ